MSNEEAGQEEVYRFRVSSVVRFLIAMSLGQERDLGKDVAATLRAARPKPRVIGEDLIPAKGPFVLAANHYERPGLRVFWGGMLVSNAATRRRRDRLHWLMTSEWYNYRIGPVRVPVPFLRWLFRRIAAVYGLVIVPRAAARAMGRAAALRSILAVSEKGEPIALFPEATGKGTLIQPAAAVGALFQALRAKRIPVLPAGIYEDGGVLTARFGQPFLIGRSRAAGEAGHERARDEVMVAIGRLLPQEMWGAYREAIAESLAGRRTTK